MFSKGKYVVPRATFFVFDSLAQSFSVPILFSSRRQFASKSKAQPKKISPFLFQSKIDENNKAAKVKKEAESTEWLELNLKEDIDPEPKNENVETQETQEIPQQIPKIKSEGVAWIKQDSNKKIGVDTRSIQLGKIQDLSDIIDFLKQPQNMILSFRERSILYDKLVKIFSVRTLKFDTVTVQPVVHDFLAKFLASLKTSQNHKLYSTVFNAAVSKELFAFCEDFYRECLTDLLFNFPALKMQDLFPSLPSVQKFYYSVEITEEHEKQARRILEMAEDCLSTMTIQNKMRVVNLMRASKVSNDKILDFMLYYVEMNFPSMRYDDMLSVTLACMGAKRITPYEIIYNLKNSFNKIHKELTPTVILKSLGAFCKLRLMYTETLYDNIFRILGTETVIGGLTSIDCVLIINYYSKVNYRDSELLEKFINKVKEDLSPLNSIHLKILVLSLAELNYNDYTIYGTLFNKFKNLMDVIQALRKEESHNQFEEVYLKAICEYISPGSSESPSSSSIETANA